MPDNTPTAHRVIARLDIKGPNLVKGIHLEGLRVLGKPEAFARLYYESGVDELIYQDAVASLYERNSLHEIITRTAKEVFIPLVVGGGLRSVDDIRQVLRAGADKVCINTAAVTDPTILSRAASIFGSSTITLAIEAIRQPEGHALASTDNGRILTEREVVAWAREGERLGAGEILLTSVDREGTGKGFDLELTREVSEAVSIPVVAHGGAGKTEDVALAITEGRADAVALASLLHYDVIRHGSRLEDYEQEGNIEFLKSGRSFSRIQTATLAEVKAGLLAAGVNCRPVATQEAGHA